MYSNFLQDLKYFTDSPKCNTLLSKIHRVLDNPGMKMVLLNRIINETPSWCLPVKFFLEKYYKKLIIKYGIDLPLKLDFGYNLRIFHHGGIVINPNSKIGNNVIIMHGVTLGNNMASSSSPILGDNVFVGVGAKIIGGVYVAKSVKIGANAVVVKNCYQKHATLVGIPAKELTTVK